MLLAPQALMAKQVSKVTLVSKAILVLKAIPALVFKAKQALLGLRVHQAAR